MRTHARSLLGFTGKDYKTMARSNRPFTKAEIKDYENSGVDS